MKTRTERKRAGMRLLVAAAVVSLALMVPAGVALADDSGVVVTGGSLGITSGGVVGDFTAVELDGANQTTTAQITDIVFTDATGTGVGWRLQLTGTALVGSEAAAGHSIPASQVTVKKLADVTPGTGVTADNPTLDGAATFALPTSATDLATAAAAAGMGEYTLDCADDMLTLVVPASSYAGTYTTSITLDDVSGPGE